MMNQHNYLINIIVLLSGNGSTLQAIIDEIENKNINAQINLVISDNADAFGITRAKNHHLAHTVIERKDHNKQISFEAAIVRAIENTQVDLVVLAGFMRVLSSDFVAKYKGKIINIHPSLLPKHKGLNTYQKVLDAGDKEHGTTVHFVTSELDGGPIIAQAKIAITENDTVQTLTEKVKNKERKLYPLVLQHFADKRLEMIGQIAYFDGKPIPSQGIPHGI